MGIFRDAWRGFTSLVSDAVSGFFDIFSSSGDNNNRRNREQNNSRRNSYNNVEEEIRRARENQEMTQRNLEAERKKREEFERRLRENQEKELKERKETQEHLKSLQEETERLKRDYRRLKDSIDDQEKKKAQMAKERIQEVAKQKEEMEQQQKEKDIIKEMDDALASSFKGKMGILKKQINDLFDNSNFVEVEKLIKEIDYEMNLIIEVLSRKNIDEVVFNSYVVLVKEIYLQVADVFFNLRDYPNAYKHFIEYYRYSKYSLDVDNLAYYKLGKSAFETGRYTEAHEYFGKFDVHKVEKSESELINASLNEMLFKIAIKSEDNKKIKEQIEKVFNSLHSDKRYLNGYTKLLEEYIRFSGDLSMGNSLLTILSKYKKSFDISKLLADTPFDKLSYKNWFLSLEAKKKGNMEEALDFLKNLKDLSIVSLERLNLKRELNKLETSDLPILSNIKDEVVTLLQGKNFQERIDFINRNENLVFINPESVDDFFYLYENLIQNQISINIKDKNDEQIQLILKEVREYAFKFTIGKDLKAFLSQYLDFLKNNDYKESYSLLFDLLKENSTENEFEAYLSSENKKLISLEEVYDLPGEAIDFIKSDFYKASLVTKFNTTEKYTLLESYYENMSSDKVRKREAILKEERLLSEKSPLFSTLYNFEINNGLIRIIYPEYTGSLMDYIKKEAITTKENLEEKKAIGLQLINIFKALEENKVYKSFIDPYLFVFNKEGKLELRGTATEKLFRSESTTSIGSTRVVSENKYKAPDDGRYLDEKSNCYLLGLLLYELFKGEYIFEGVKDFITISDLHSDRPVEKSKVYNLNDRWSFEKNSLKIRILKISPKDGFAPSNILELIEKLLKSEKAERLSLDDVEKIFMSQSKEVQVAKVSKGRMEEDELIEFIKSNDFERAFVNSSTKELVEGLNLLVEDIKLLDKKRCDLVLQSKDKQYAVRFTGYAYIVEEEPKSLVKYLGDQNEEVHQITEELKRLLEKVNEKTIEDGEINMILLELDGYILDIENDKSTEFTKNLLDGLASRFSLELEKIKKAVTLKDRLNILKEVIVEIQKL